MASLNDSSSSGNGSCGEVDTVGRPVFIAICSLLFVVSVLLNGFTLRVYCCRAPPPRRSSSVTVYLQNLAAADFLLGLCLPLRIAHYSSPSPVVQWAYCYLGAPAFYLNMYASILFMGYIAANRYLKVVRSLESHALLRAAGVISTVTWASLLTPMGVYVGMSLAQAPTPGPTSAVWECSQPRTPALRLLYRLVHSSSAITFFLALAALVAFYGSTARQLALAQRRPSVGGAVGGAGAGRRCHKLARARRNMLVLVAVFCVCFVPYHLVRLPYVFLGAGRPGCPPARPLRLLKEASVMLSALNVCLDPLIYFFFCRAFRRQVALGGVLLGRPPGGEDSQTSLSTMPSLDRRVSMATRRTSVV